ncbi:MAG: hypothetical protein ACRDPA_30055, partial [Solirubrobacteraceae bacterium]
GVPRVPEVTAAVARTAPELPRGPRAFGPCPAETVAAPLPGPPAWPLEPVRLPRLPREDYEPPAGAALPDVAGVPDCALASLELGDEEVGLPLAGEPECDPPPSVVLTGGIETLGVLTDGVVMLGVLTGGVVTLGVLTCGVVIGPTVIDGVVTEGVLIEGTETVGTVTVGTLTVGIDSVGPAAIAAAAALAGTSNTAQTTRMRSRIPLMARATDYPTAR